MSFLHKFQKKSFNKKEIDNLLLSSKNSNRKYLYEVISIKGITFFDACYILNKLNLNSKKIKAIKHVLAEYEKRIELQADSYDDFLHKVVRNMETIEYTNSALIKEIEDCKKDIEGFNLFVEYLISKSIYRYNRQTNFMFSTIYLDK